MKKKAIRLRTVNDKDYLTIEEASDLLDIKQTAIRNYLYLNKLTTYKFKNITLLSVKEVKAWHKRNT